MQKCSAIIAKRSVLYSFSAYTLRTPLRRKYAINNVKLMHNKSASIKSKCLTQLFFFTYKSPLLFFTQRLLYTIVFPLLSIYNLYIFIKNLMYILVFIIFIICFVHIYTTSIKITYTLIQLIANVAQLFFFSIILYFSSFFNARYCHFSNNSVFLVSLFSFSVKTFLCLSFFTYL